MPGHKALKSISHNFSHSLISLMNYTENDYFLGHLLTQVRKTKIRKFNIDILNNVMEPDSLITPAIKESVNTWIKLFPDLVERSGSSMEYIVSAQLTIEFFLSQTRFSDYTRKHIENPYICEFVITDDRGKIYKSEHEGWWFANT